jgi:paraquat-inducible protein A
VETIACPECDLLQHVPALAPGGKAQCARCGCTLATQPRDPIDRPLALTLAAAVAFVVANAAPLMSLSAVGRHASTTILGGAWAMWQQGEPITAAVVAFCAVLAPGGYLLFMLTVLLGARRRPAPQWVGELLRWADSVQPWAMTEVMVLGLMVALIKIAELATVTAGVGMYAVGALVVLVPAIMVAFQPREIWGRVVWADGSAPTPGATGPMLRGLAVVEGLPPTAARAGLVACETCALLARPVEPHEPGHCPRCGAGLEGRHHHSVQYTWALVIAAAICYVPANVLPVMTTTAFGSTEPDTILGGVVFLYTSGSWPLALMVLVASVMVPLGKLVALAYLLVTVQRGSVRSLRERTRLYRLVEIIGRWSMLDVFVATFTVALVQLQPLMSVQPGAGVLFFAAVVVLTMLAAESFDPRLIWDAGERRTDDHS